MQFNISSAIDVNGGYWLARPQLIINPKVRQGTQQQESSEEDHSETDGSFGRESYSSGRLRMIGKIMPALRAVLDGVNSATTTSDSIVA